MDLSKQLDRAREAVTRGNDEYAVQLYQDLLALAPDNLQARKELLEAVVRKYRKLGVPSAGKATAYTKGLMPFIKAHVLGMMGKHLQAMIECEKFLAFEPSDRGVRKVLAKSARSAGYRDTAIWVCEWLADTNKKDAEVLYALGELYEEKGDIDAAIEWFERYRGARPTDRRTDGHLRNLDAQRTMVKSGWGEAGDKGAFKKFVRDAEKAQDLVDETRMVRTLEDWQRSVDRVKRDLAEDPNGKKLMVQLGDTYRDGAEYKGYREVYPTAREWYEKARTIDKADYTIVERLEDLQIREFDYQIAELKQQVSEKSDPGKRASIQQLEKQRGEYGLRVFIERVKNRPTDTSLRYELAQLFFRYNQIDHAMQQYQHAVRDPKLRRVSLNRLGQCLMRKGINDMAIARFEEAMQGVVVLGPEEKDILYNLGTAAEAAGLPEKAEGAFRRIYEADIGFKDVAQKIEDIYRRRTETQTKGATG
jgi:tetratricopeptide (TPR) repeat protein